MNSVIPCHLGTRCNWPACLSDCDGRPGREPAYCLRASHDRLIAAAKRVQRISHAPFPPDGNAFDAFEALDAAIAAAEELKL